MKSCIVGGKGFIGSHLARYITHVTTYDLRDGQDAHDLDKLTEAFTDIDTVFHLASNADIAAAAENPMIDFTEGTVLTQNVCEAARRAGVTTIVYASGSGVYGENINPYEDSAFEPVSPYGASKVAGEALVSAYAHMFGIRGIAFRFANVVGPRQTHGVGFDFINKLKADPTKLEILGNGNQRKSYIAVSDVMEAIFTALDHSTDWFTAYNVGTKDTLTVRQIANIVCEQMGITPSYAFTGGRGGWPGDVPVMHLNSDRIRSLGWSNKMTSREAMQWAIKEMLND